MFAACEAPRYVDGNRRRRTGMIAFAIDDIRDIP